jgi:hypothetical protein
MTGLLASGKFTPEEVQKLLSEGFQVMDTPFLPPGSAWLWKPQPDFQLYSPRKSVLLINLKEDLVDIEDRR